MSKRRVQEVAEALRGIYMKAEKKEEEEEEGA